MWYLPCLSETWEAPSRLLLVSYHISLRLYGLGLTASMAPMVSPWPSWIPMTPIGGAFSPEPFTDFQRRKAIFRAISFA
eukprot:22277_4